MKKDSDFMKERNLLHKLFGDLMPKTAKSYNDLLEVTLGDGALPSKLKELIALGVSVCVRCEPCMNYHIEKAMSKGATKEEVLEAMNVGYWMGVGQIIPPLRKVLRNQFGRQD